MEDLENQMNSNKEMIFDKEYVKVKKDTFDSMKKVIDETKKVMEIQPKIMRVYNEVDEYAKSYEFLETENNNIKKEVKYLINRNYKLEQEKDNLMTYIKAILKAAKKFLSELLLIGNERVKTRTTEEIKEYYEQEDFTKDDVVDIAINTDKEDELFDYIGVDKSYEKEENDIDIEI